MDSLPIVTIVGRPNVGKSSLLNCIARRRVSIVDPTAGVTRDRVSVVISREEQYFELIDTGGYGIEDHDNLTDMVERQIEIAVDAADLILFVVDVRDGRTALDERVAELLRKNQRPVWLVANKADTAQMNQDVHDFNALGFGEPAPISAKHRAGISDLLERIWQHLGETQRPREPVMKLAIVGKRNAGKSTFINTIAGAERVIVSEVPGTTRDAVDVRFEKDDQTIVAIDTAGVRKKKSAAARSIDFYSYVRAAQSIRRADVILFFIDATEPVSQVDKKLGGYIAEQLKPCVIVVNKWDLAKDRASHDDYRDYLDRTLRALSHAPMVVMTATQDRNVQRSVDIATGLFKQSLTRVSTARLNAAMEQIGQLRGPGGKSGRAAPRVYYATQIATGPPTIVLFVNRVSAITQDYRRFLINQFRVQLPFKNIPIRLLVRAHREARKPAATSRKN